MGEENKAVQHKALLRFPVRKDLVRIASDHRLHRIGRPGTGPGRNMDKHSNLSLENVISKFVGLKSACPNRG
jgi:hypothetical protein